MTPIHAQDVYVPEAEIDLDDIDPLHESSHSLLGQNHATRQQPEHEENDVTVTRRGRLRAYWLGLVVCLGGFLFGYDSGIIGGVLTLESFARDYRYTLPNPHVASLSVGLQQAGAFAACFAIWPITHRYGRKWPIVWCSFVFIIGALIQTWNTHQIALFYLGRFISGVGLGGNSVIVPMFSSEMAPKQLRGSIGSFYQWMFTLGIFASYWIDWTVAQVYPSTTSHQWQIPIGLQCAFAVLLCIGATTLKESTRWLTQHDLHDAAWESLKWIRADESDSIRAEMEEIRHGVEDDTRARHGFRLQEMFDRDGPDARRTFTAVTVFTAQQATGATAFAYFGPQYFQLLTGARGNTSLFLTTVFGIVKVVSCTIFILSMADRFDRRTVLTTGAVCMASCQLLTAAVTATHPTSHSSPTAPAHTGLTPSAMSTVILIYLFVAAYNFSWGPLPWPYVSEIFPSRTREPGIAIGVACQWFGNFFFSFTTPYMITNLGWGTFVVWGLFDIAIAMYAWMMLEETRGLSLEEITKSIDQGQTTTGEDKDD